MKYKRILKYVQEMTAVIINVKQLITRQAMYLYRNNEVCSCNHCSSAKEIGITYSECVFVALCILHSMRKRRTSIYGLSDSTVYFRNYLTKGTIFEKEIIEPKCVV
jgi:hypothetical protein